MRAENEKSEGPAASVNAPGQKPPVLAENAEQLLLPRGRSHRCIHASIYRSWLAIPGYRIKSPNRLCDRETRLFRALLTFKSKNEPNVRLTVTRPALLHSPPTLFALQTLVVGAKGQEFVHGPFVLAGISV